MTKKIKTEKAVAKVFSILIKTDKGEILWQEVAYGLEDAFLQAKNNLRFKHPEVDLDTSKIYLFISDTLDDLLDRSESVDYHDEAEIKKPEEVIRDTKSALMQEIIDKKDKVLYLAHANDFTDFEKKFLLDKLKGKK